MIFGEINFQISLKEDQKKNTFFPLDNLPELKKIPVVFFNFSGFFLLNIKFPFKENDYFFCDFKKKILILTTGNIFNRAELLSLVRIKKNTPNPELISLLFDSYGPEFVKKLNGDFAIFIYRVDDGNVFLFRDHLGVKPLAYTRLNQKLIFSSNILGLCQTFQAKELIQIDPLISNFKAVDHLFTLNPKVKKVKPGHYIHFKNGMIESKKYWFPEEIKPNKNLSYPEMLAEAEFLLNDSIRIRCDKRFNAGAHLSGGLDSSIVAAIARKINSEQETFYGFSWSPKVGESNDVPYDERDLAIEVAEKNNITPVFNTIGKEETLTYVNNYFDNLGYFPEAKTIENARRLNVNLLFSGWGGDEFISKESSGIDTDLLFQFKLKSFFKRNPIGKPRKLAQTLYYFILLPALGVLDHPMKKAYKFDGYFIKKEYKKHHKATLKRFFFYKSRRERHLNFLYNYYLSERTEWWNIMGFRNGVEYRYPLLDKRIIEFILKIPSRLMYRGNLNRIILRDLGKQFLPETVINRVHYNDPVYGKNKAKYNKELFLLFKDEINIWKHNKDLYFIDFEILEKEIGLFEKDPDSKDFNNLFSNVIFFKSLHEFTKTYRSLPPESE
jgi:asparagine synthase (glutamine-hydrolysing)